MAGSNNHVLNADDVEMHLLMMMNLVIRLLVE